MVETLATVAAFEFAFICWLVYEHQQDRKDNAKIMQWGTLLSEALDQMRKPTITAGEIVANKKRVPPFQIRKFWSDERAELEAKANTKEIAHERVVQEFEGLAQGDTNATG